MADLLPDNIHIRLQGSKKSVAVALKKYLPDESFIVWYEPQFDLEGEGEKPHFLILDKDRGILVIEVEGRRVARFSRTQIMVMPRGMNVSQVVDPSRRAQQFIRRLETAFAEDEELGDLVFGLWWAVAVPGLTRDEAFKRGFDEYADQNRVLFQDDLALPDARDLPEKFISLMFDRKANRISDAQIDRIRALMHPETSVPIQRALFSNDHDVLTAMDFEQERLARRLGDGHRLIRGVTGSGKTVVLVARAKLLAENFPNQRFLVTCYNRPLAADLRAKLSEYTEPVHVFNVASLAGKVLYRAGNNDPGIRPEDRGRFAKAAREALSTGVGERYDAILVDESQDFILEELLLVKDSLKPGKADIVLAADAAQRINSRGFSWKDADLDMRGRVTPLDRNYRNTRQILRFAYDFLVLESDDDGTEARELTAEDKDVIVKPSQALRDGPKPDLYSCRSRSEGIQAVVSAVKTWAHQIPGSRRIGLLFNLNERDLIDSIQSKLMVEGVSVFRVEKTKDSDTRDQVAQAEEQVVLSTVRHSKGLEFPCVALLGLNHAIDDDESFEIERRMLYVGMTRARDRLAIFVGPDNNFATHFQIVAEQHGNVKRIEP